MIRGCRYCLFLCLLLAGGLFPVSAWAAGVSHAVPIPAEQVLITYAEGYQEIITSIRVEEAATQAALVFPVPGVPEVAPVPDGLELFAYLEAATRPTEQVVERLVWQPEAPPAASSVDPTAETVERSAQEQRDEYEVTVLEASDTAALNSWLDAHDYTLPPEAQTTLEAYRNSRWSFVVVSLSDITGAHERLAPLRIRFATNQIIYPMRLGTLPDQPHEMQIYLLADQRMTMEPLDTVYAGAVAQLSPTPPGHLAPLLERAPYLTRLHRTALEPPAPLTDLVAQAAPTNAPYRQTVTVYEDIPLQRQAGVLMALLCLVVMNVMTIGIALSFKRRFDAISPDRR